MQDNRLPLAAISWVTLFAIAFAFVESSIVVYLRALYYPEGFQLPLRPVSAEHLIVEICREAATLIMLATTGIIAGKTRWQRFGYFCLAFGVWDIFYYVWLKVILGWPASLMDWDVLFLIPLPWIGPVISAASIALLLTLCGIDIIFRTSREKFFRPGKYSWLFAIVGTGVVLYSFMYDTGATLYGDSPKPYRFDLLVLGLILYGVAYAFAGMRGEKEKPPA